MERLSIELTDRCEKGCAFCYARARPEGASSWHPEDVVALVRDCAAHGTRAVSFGGGEPLEYPPLLDVLRATRGLLFRSVTTSGLRLDEALDALVAARPDKVHVSIHDPADGRELRRVIRQVGALAERGVPAGVNLLVRRSSLAAATSASAVLRGAGIGAERVVWLPLRLHGDTPAPEALAAAAGGPFQSTTCLTRCAPSPRFASLDAHRRAAACSYTSSRAPLGAMTRAALLAALAAAPLTPCGGSTP